MWWEVDGWFWEWLEVGQCIFVERFGNVFFDLFLRLAGIPATPGEQSESPHGEQADGAGLRHHRTTGARGRSVHGGGGGVWIGDPQLRGHLREFLRRDGIIGDSECGIAGAELAVGLVGESEGQQLEVIRVDHTIVVEVAVEPLRRSGSGEADSELPKVVRIDHAAEVGVAEVGVFDEDLSAEQAEYSGKVAVTEGVKAAASVVTGPVGVAARASGCSLESIVAKCPD